MGSMREGERAYSGNNDDDRFLCNTSIAGSAKSAIEDGDGTSLITHNVLRSVS